MLYVEAGVDSVRVNGRFYAVVRFVDCRRYV